MPGQGQAVWVTGATGFVGRHLTRQLLAAGDAVVSFGRRPMAGTPPGQIHLPGPLDPSLFDEALRRSGPPARIFHLAGGETVARSLSDPLADFESSVTTTAVVLDALRRLAPEAGLVITSSAAVYGSGTTGPIPTGGVLTPLSPYGVHKLLAERLVQSQARCYGLRGTILRMFSLYGPGIRKQLLFDACRRLSAGETPLLLGGKGTELRDWLHVDDAVRAMLALALPRPSEVDLFNLGTGTGTDIHSVARLVARSWDDAPVAFSGQSRAGDPESLVAAPASLPPGFSPQVDLAAGIAGFVDWFKADAKAKAWGGRAW